MINDKEILAKMIENSVKIEFDIITDFTDLKNPLNINYRIFKAKVRPVTPPLCFFKKKEELALKDRFDLFSFFPTSNDYTIVPFGSKAESADGFGLSYNVFLDDLPIQNYTVR